MNFRSRRASLAFLWAICVAAGAAAALGTLGALPASAKEVPALDGRVMDQAGVLSAPARARIQGELRTFEAQTGDQVAVLIVPSLEGEPVENFSVKVAHAWHLGQKGKDNGVLLLVAQQEHKVRIEVGYGLEGVLTDLRSNEIIDGQIRPRFKAGDYDGGVEQGVAAIEQAVRGGPAAAAGHSGAYTGGHPPPSLAVRVIFGCCFFVFMSVFGTIAVLSRGFQSWFLYVFLTPFLLAFPFALYGGAVAFMLVGLWLVAFPIVKFLRRNAPPPAKKSFAGRVASSSKRSSGWTFVSSSSGDSSSSSSSSSSDSSSSDSFSGGGGDFGGGGASGDW